MSVRIFVGKKIVGKKICHWQKNSSFFGDFFSSNKVLVSFSNTWNLYHGWWRYFDINMFIFINWFPWSCELDSPQKKLAAQSFTYFVCNFWQTAYFVLPQNIRRTIRMIVGNSYGRFSRKKIELSSALISCSHIACNFTNRKLLF